ncbi:BQ5605_C004g02745 [Microbotryum silenes-dioicae]|uniref:BQ5605_C004g02745 protein n=1 Tax=Microbotryum silenes-dioicae TaxID=796604 RepID=A0A2X0PB17_9BASI|nr:BQ5605_C004g02745 [Microbotryum silenes-dioicae]
MTLVCAWGRKPPSRYGPAKKPAGQRKQGEANREAAGKAKKSEVSSEQQPMLRAKIVTSSKRE